ncbi:MAG: alcohol dehydrogenase catalytic domain-containing protein, partial [Luminiphilus sp.]
MAKAVVCSEHGLPDKLNLVHDWETPELGPNDVRMEVKAAGLNFPDVLIIQGKYQMQPPMPFVPGGESAGVVTEVGSAVTRWSVGDSVIQLGGVGGFASEAVVNEN